MVDPITLEVVKNSLIEISEEMGVTLKRASYSPNIKERNDFSCALFREDSRMISQAEHLPVHLGSMIFSVKQALEDFGIENIEDGDMVVLNDPYRGGTHLPDITLIAPIYYNGELVAFSANRAHHADIGGISPGSMCGTSTEVCQEGVRIPPVKLYKKGKPVDDIFKLILAQVRTPQERIGDLRAQAAANLIAKRRTVDLIEKYGLDIVRECTEELMNYSERKTRAEIEKIPDGEYVFTDYMEGDGIEDKSFKIQVKITVKNSDMIFDYTGTDKQASGPINAVLAVTTSVTYYVVRCITDPTIPPNSGHYRPVQIIAPEGTLVNPVFPAPVAGGNVETSQRITDVLLGALAQIIPERVIAACNGSMTSITWGGVNPEDGKPYAYYETLGGGFGARPTKDGIDGIHTHMTNTQNTPIEALEIKLPIRIDKYALRPDTGGAGKYRGGCGIERNIRLIKGEARISILAERHSLHPYGLNGGEPGGLGESLIYTKSGETIKLKSKDTAILKEGDLWIIRSPGAGGYGNPSERDFQLVLKDIRNELVTPKTHS
ncbi:hydantoinase B/oxoprolinase family protein [Dehalococcoidia bacterium]|nr:hydantoinase B/oxoprolinase family protein [Dehalococcoidia bacterium]